MIAAPHALEKVLELAALMPMEHIDLERTTGRVLALDALADRDHPPFDRVTMDGIAIRHEDFQQGINTYKIIQTVLAGYDTQSFCGPGQAVRAMTGAPLPPGIDSVVRVEDVQSNSDGEATVTASSINLGQNIHRQGTDAFKGQVVIERGTSIHAGHMAILATMGHASVPVFQLPKVLVVVTGQELVSVNEIPLPHQIRQSNGWMLTSLLQKLGIKPVVAIVNDDFNALFNVINEGLKTYDVIVTTGGVSMGMADHLPEVFRKCGVQEAFYKVAQRPGKPLWFGKCNNVLVFGLPGNPMSVLVTAVYYLLPAIQKMTGRHTEILRTAVLSTSVSFNPELTCFLPVSVHESPDGRSMAVPIQGHGSGDLIQMAALQGWVILPAQRRHFDAGEVLAFLPMHSY